MRKSFLPRRLCSPRAGWRCEENSAFGDYQELSSQNCTCPAIAGWLDERCKMLGCYSLLAFTFILEDNKKRTRFKSWKAHSSSLK